MDEDGEREISLSAARAHAAGDPTLQSMIDKGLPLCRNAYLMASYGPELPSDEEWNAEHEAGLPRPFQRPLNRPMRAKK